ncbi:MAG: BBP7 family outer membrane beta-barrel protein [Planctomycetes bacterium]|nr:BBP7 family outer membrane beta-barrel protein [Planctomycetota bacterium]
MRNGVLGFIVVMTAGASLAWGQSPPTGGLGSPSIIPPPLPEMMGGYPGGGPNGGPGGPVDYPPPLNWDGLDPNGSNGAPGAGGGNNAGAIPRLWIMGEYLFWAPRSTAYSAPLLTSGSATSMGAVGLPTTNVLYGQNVANFDFASGARINTGLWFDQYGRLGFNVSGFFLENKQENYNAVSSETGTPLLARPFFDPSLGANTSYVIGAPNFATVTAFNRTQTASYGVEGNFLATLLRTSSERSFGYTLGFIAGFRFMSLSDTSEIGSQSDLLLGGAVLLNNQIFAPFNTTATTVQSVGGGVGGVGGATVTTTTTQTISNISLFLYDRFKTQNNFYGGNIGLYNQFRFGSWSIGLTGKVALGSMHQVVETVGSSKVTNSTTRTINTNVVAPGPVVTNSSSTSTTSQNFLGTGGIYAQSDQLGRYQRNTFAAVPELNLTLGYQFTPALAGYFGYTMIYMSNVVRASDLVTGQSVTALQPTSATFGTFTNVPSRNMFPSSSFVLQGFNAGFSIRY